MLMNRSPSRVAESNDGRPAVRHYLQLAEAGGELEAPRPWLAAPALVSLLVLSAAADAGGEAPMAVKAAA
ncbi:MAG: hypothetical protein KBC50_01830 [Candidatus Pacebacteria bacterium]|nr:hypothetical protein [Candidatus Paceibacterota bacterium]